jgi:hypothetical protein
MKNTPYLRDAADRDRLLKQLHALRSGDKYKDVVGKTGTPDIDQLVYADAWRQSEKDRRRRLFYFIEVADTEHLRNDDKYIELYFGPDDVLYSMFSTMSGVQSWGGNHP